MAGGCVDVPGVFHGMVYVDLWLAGRIQRRKQEVELALPDLLDLLTVSVEAGLGFEGALMKIIEKTNGLLTDEFLTVLREIKMGKARREALKDMATRLNVDMLSNFIGSIIMAEQLGISIANILRIQSVEMRQKKRQKAEETAMKAPIKMLIPMVFFIFPAIFIVLLGPAVIQIMRAF
jgi:tight adherence protein C